MKSPLEGIRVIDATAFGAAPIAGAFLADWGAEVIHIEHPIRGDGTRGVQYGTGVGIFQQARVNYAMEFYNHSKKSVTLDFAQEKGREIMYRLVKTADVFVSILRPYELEKYGLEYGQLSQLNPKLIYAHLGGYGRKGPDRDRPGYDSCAFFARSGITHQLSTYCKSPIINRPALGDNMTGLALFAGVVLALLVRERLGIGQEVDVSLFNTGILSLALDIQGAILTGENVTTEPRETTSNPLRNFYQTKDERWILLAMMQPDPYWPRFCKAIEREELEHDPRFDSFEHRRKNCADLIIILDEAFVTRTLAEWKERLSKFNLIFEPVQSPTEVANDPQAIANEYFSDFDHLTYGPIKIVGAPIKLSETPATIRSAAPEFSQNTEEVLLELGYSWEDILSLKDQKVIS
jgi:crotonobetainyl-CoA:carnitine CoA-transferase CaiB-like acyl-CoA transferase